MSWIDIIFIALIVIFAIIGLWKGLLDSILGLVTTLVSLGISIWCAKPVAKFLRKIVDVDNIFYKMLKSFFGESETKTIFGIELTREKLSAFLTVAFSALIVFILIRLAVWIISKLFDSATASSSALSGLNRVFGLLFGTLKGLLIGCLILGGCYLVTRTGLTNNLDTKLDNTKVVSFFYKHTGNFISDKLTGDKVQSIIDDLEIPKREDPESKPKNNIAIHTDSALWRIKLTYKSTEKTNFDNDLNHSYVLYYDIESKTTSIGLFENDKVDISFYNSNGDKLSNENLFTLGDTETEKTIKMKIVYNKKIDEIIPPLIIEIKITK